MPYADGTLISVGPKRILAFVATITVLRIALGVIAWEPGWTALTWDDFTRVAIAQKWAADPTLVPDLVWLPLSTWVHGSAFALFGSLVGSNPMLLAAVINTVALFATAAVVAWSALRLSGSWVGSMVAASFVLFSPWGFFASLSGLGESLYYLTVVAAVGCTIAWLQTSRPWWLVLAAISLSAGAAARYEGWVLFAAWAAVLAFHQVRTHGSSKVWSRANGLTFAILLIPGATVLAWLLVNWHRAGDPFFFAKETARYFSEAYGAVYGVVPRLAYYPLSLLRSAPLLLAILGIVILARRDHPIMRVLVPIFAVQFGLLYGSSVLSPVVGAFNERFMFAIALGLTPLLGFVPSIIRSLQLRPSTVAALVIACVVITAVRLADRPIEWTHGPDLLETAEVLGDLATGDDPLTVILGPGFEFDTLPLSVRNGNRLEIHAQPTLGLSGPPLGARTVWLEKLPSRTRAISAIPAAIVGRYHMYANFSIPVEPCEGCDGWRQADAWGELPLRQPGSYLSLEFLDDNPPPGARSVLERQIPRTSESQVVRLELRSLYGHGFNPGRIQLEVSLDGEPIFVQDIAAHSRWHSLEVVVEPGPGTALLQISVRALPGIEPDWAWGRSSIVLVRSLRVSPQG